MLQPGGCWKHIKWFITSVKRMKDLDRRREGRYNSQWGLHPWPCVPGRPDGRASKKRNLYALQASAAPRLAELMRAEGLGRTDDGKVVHDLKPGTSRSWSLKPKGGSASGNMIQKRGFLVSTGMPSLVLGKSCTTFVNDFAIFPSHLGFYTHWKSYL